MTTAISPNFRYWDSIEPATFLAHDWANPSRAWATKQAIHATKRGTLLEVGPGPGVDYARHFRKLVRARKLLYTAYEGSANLCKALEQRFPEVRWHCKTLADLPERSVDVVYARHVMEHQPTLEPALGTLLQAARKAVVLTWYRPPGAKAFHELYEALQGVHCHTFARDEVLYGVARAGFMLTRSQPFTSGDEAWVLERV